jgi:hypothetical protein
VNYDATMYEYIDATRGLNVESGELERLVQLVIEGGCEFLPPAGALLVRAATLAAQRKAREYSPSTTVADRIAMDVEAIRARLVAKSEFVEPVDLDDLRYAISGNHLEQARIEP